MDNEVLCRTLSNMMPGDIRVAAGQSLSAPLTASEQASLGIVNSRRILEFKSGRAYAKRALRMLGVDGVDLPIGSWGSPVWPTGFVGSITHTRRGDGDMYVAAAVASSEVILAIGIDFEISDGLPPYAWPLVMTKRELGRILSFPETARRLEAHYIWCAKEATAKILDGPFDPSTLEVERNSENGDFIVTVEGDDRKDSLTGLLGRTACLDDLVIATAVLPRRYS
jgi:4'-phosphopantetheinyl transferase EntD